MAGLAMANRRRIEMSTQIFQRLISHANDAGVQVSNAEKPRWIRKLNDDDALLMARADVPSQQKITRQIRALQIEHNEARYFAVLGLTEVDTMPDGLGHVELTPGLFSVVITQSDIQPSATALEVLNAIGARHAEDKDFDGYDLSDISLLFPDISIFEADQNHEYTSNVVRVLGALTARSYSDGPIEPSADTLAKVSSLFEGGSAHIPFENILQGLLSISWGGFFLELYRAVEQLYAVPRLLALVEAWPTPLSYRQLADLLENHLSWRPKEDDALAKLINGCDSVIVQELAETFSKDRDTSQGNLAGKVASDIYRVRNSLVHFKAALGQENHTDYAWEPMIVAMLDLVQDIYQRHGARFNYN